MLKELYVAELLHKHRQMELQQVSLHAWKYAKEKTKWRWSFFPSLVRPKPSVCCEPCC